MQKITIPDLVCRWATPGARPLFKGNLISDDGCCCAQGDALRFAGMSDDELRRLEQSEADRKVAEVLGISVAHSVLLRKINDSREGSPQDVLANPEKILGPHARLVLAFWKHLDTVDWDAAWDAAWAAARDAARDAAWAAARDAAWASNEIQGYEVIKVFYFLPIFGITISELKKQCEEL